MTSTVSVRPSTGVGANGTTSTAGAPMTATETPHHATASTTPRATSRGGVKPPTPASSGSSPKEGAPGLGFKQVVDDVLETSRHNDPQALAAEILGRLTPKQMQEGLGIALPEYVRNVISHRARMMYVPDPDPQRRVRAQAPAWDRHKHLLAARILGLEEWKPFGDFTPEDCVAAAELRRRKAQESVARAVKFQATAEAVNAAGVACVADLPADVLLGLWGSHDLED